AKRARRGVARVRKNGAAGGGLLLVELQKRRACHVDLAAYLAYLRRSAPAHLCRDIADPPYVGSDILSFRTITAGRGPDENAPLITQGQRQAVDLRLGGELDRLGGLELEEAAHAIEEAGHVLPGEGVGEREHRHRVAYLGKPARRRAAHPLSGRVRRNELRMLALEAAQLSDQRVVIGIGDLRPVQL